MLLLSIIAWSVGTGIRYRFNGKDPLEAFFFGSIPATTVLLMFYVLSSP